MNSLRTQPGRSIICGFLDALAKHADRPAIVVGAQVLHYAELAQRAGRIARRLSNIEASAGPRLGAIFGGRGVADYVGVVGTLLSGAGFVPLNAKFPDERNAFILNVTRASSLIVDAESLPRLDALLPRVEKPLTIVLPETDNVTALAAAHGAHTFLGRRDIDAAAPRIERPPVDASDIAYLTFTSGSTGVPKGVMETHQNILHHIDASWELYDISEADRLSQTFDLTFDPSIFDIFCALGRGASLHVLSAKEKRAPDRFIREHELTIWFCVPSVAMMMRSFKLLRPGIFPALRYSFFVGERLESAIAQAWQEAAPNSRVENLYGPTETTNVCTRYLWKGEAALGECVAGGVPIGIPFPGMTTAVVDSALQLCAVGVQGELCIRGPQVTPGYWQDDAQTAQRFVPMPWDFGPANRWYRTGDLAILRADGELVHCGRNDDQVKIQGYRLELGEVEHALRRIAQTDFLAVLARSRDGGTSYRLTAVVAHSQRSSAQILAAAKEHLPTYMVPQQMVFLPELPLNSNGKIDKRQISRILDERDASDDEEKAKS